MEQVIVERHTKKLAHSINRTILMEELSQSPNWSRGIEQTLNKLNTDIEIIRKLDESERVLLLTACDETDHYLCCVNKKTQPISILVPIISMGLIGSYIAYDVANKKELGMVDDTLVLNLLASETRLIKLISIK